MRRSYLLHVGLNGVYNEMGEFMAGESVMFSGPVDKIPAGYLIEDGSEVGRDTYATLFAIIGTTYGHGDGATTFNLPDSRGEFWRGLDMGRGVDVGRQIGSTQLDSLQGHGHEAGFVNQSNYAPGVTGAERLTAGAGSKIIKLITDGVNGVPRASSETRGRNIAKIPLIKYS